MNVKKSLAKKAFDKVKKLKVKYIRGANKLKKTPAWRAFANFIKARDKYTCITCGKKAYGPYMHTGHFIQASGHLSVFFDEMNNNAQCVDCNIALGGDSGRYSKKLVERYGQEKIDDLIERGSMTHPGYTKEDLKIIKEKYEQKLEELT